MSREWIAAFGFILIFVLVAWRVPIDIAMGIAGVLGFGMVVGAQPTLNLFGNVLLSVLTDDNLSVIPLLVIFVLCGIMTETDVSKLFFAGVVPRLLAVALYVGCVMFNYPPTAALAARRAAAWMARTSAQSA